MKNIRIFLILLLLSTLYNCKKESFSPIEDVHKKNYIKTSYQLSNYDNWLSSNDIYYNGAQYTEWNPLIDQQFCQIDINGDGLEDIFYYDSYLLTEPISNKTPSIFINNGHILNKESLVCPNIINSHGSKLLIGDFNNDSYPDIFSCVGFDLPTNSANKIQTQVCHLLFNLPDGFKIKEFDDQIGFWHTGCSGDIDNDGDLDIIIFNFNYHGNNVCSKILWNDGKGNFTYDISGFSEIAPVDHSELYDVNNDGFLDLVISYIDNSINTKNIVIMWGNGKDFNLSNSTSFVYSNYLSLMDIDFTDINNDGISEIIISGTDISNGTNYGFIKYFIDIYQSNNKGNTFIKKTKQYFDINYFTRFGHMIIKDIDNNSKLDIYASDKKDNIRWEWNGSMFIKK